MSFKATVKLGQRMTKRVFDRLMVKGWKEQKKGFERFNLSDPTQTRFCAMGVVASQVPGLVRTSEYDGRLSWDDYNLVNATLPEHRIQLQIVEASNSSQTKNEAIRKVKAIRW